jgi:hypothetical protein
MVRNRHGRVSDENPGDRAMIIERRNNIPN